MRERSGVGSTGVDWSSSSVSVEFNLECSRLMRASLRLSSTEYPRIKQPRIVAEAIE